MSYALNVMRNAGMKIARIEHDMTNAPALALYRGLGFRLKYETVGFRRSALTNLL
jgi:ribosomal protein S18 acetylase RimI-like enzyme